MKTTLKYLTIAAILVASLAGISAATPLARFRILIDTNNLNISEINSGVGPLAADGVWAVTQNNCGLDCESRCLAREGFSQNNPDVPPSVWPGVLAALNAASWTTTEDEAFHGGSNPPVQTLNNNDYAAVSAYIGQPASESLAYWEYFSLPPPKCPEPPQTCINAIISPEEIQNLALSHMWRDSIIFLARSFYGPTNDQTSDSYWVIRGLGSDYDSGVVFEINPKNLVSSDPGRMVDGINYCLKSGKRCYLLLPPNGDGMPPWFHRNNHNGFPNYSSDISEVISYLYNQGSPLVPLDNPNLFFVLAAYARDTIPPPIPNCPIPTPNPDYVMTSPGFLTGDGDTGDANSVLAAVTVLQSYRNLYVPQAAFGVLASVGSFLDTFATSHVTGWAIDPETFAGSAQSIQVQFYVGGPIGSGTFAGSITANIPRPAVNAATGFLGNHGFRFPIPTAYLDRRPHSWYAYGISVSGKPSLLAGSPITATFLPAINVSLPTDSFDTSVATTTVIIEPAGKWKEIDMPVRFTIPRRSLSRLY